VVGVVVGAVVVAGAVEVVVAGAAAAPLLSRPKISTAEIIAMKNATETAI